MDTFKLLNFHVPHTTTATGALRHGQGGGALAPWKCCKVFCELAVTVKRPVDQLFMHYFRNFSPALHFSERELKFMFAICRRPSVCRLSVCNIRVPYSGD